MAWKFSEQEIGLQSMTETSTTQKHPLGKIVRAEDGTYGGGEFIYLKGVASTAIGSVVEYDTSYQTGLVTVAMAIPRPIAVAMSANVADQYGWYQISGEATLKKASAVSFAAAAAVGAGSGLAIAAVTGLVVQGALVNTAASGASAVTSVQVMINRPHGPSSLNTA